jgi:hypothetical protein
VAFVLSVAAAASVAAQGGRGFSRPEPLDFDDHTGWTSRAATD